MSTATVTLEPTLRSRRWRRPVAVLVVLVVAFALFAALSMRGGSATGGPAVVDAAQLRSLSTSLGHAVFWAGSPTPGAELEVTKTHDGSVYVRYLDGGAEAGDERRTFTTVGTYPVPTAFAVLGRQAQRPTAVTRDLPGGGLAVLDVKRPQSVYLAWPNSAFEVEVFAPSPKRALDLVLAGTIVPVR